MTPSRRAWVLVVSAWLAVLAALLTWLMRTPSVSLREQLKVLQFWSLELCVGLVLALGAVVLRDIVRRLDRRDGLMMLMPVVLALGLTLFVAPRTNRIYYDEQIYQNVAQNLADLRLAQMCNDGTVEYGRLQCSSGEYNKQPYAYPHLLSLAYRAFGVTETTAFVVNAIVMAVTVSCVYLLVLILFGDRVAAFFAGLLIALTPQQLSWSATAAVEPSASLALLAALLCAAHASRSMSTVALAATGVAAAYAVQFRPESFLIVPVIGSLLWRQRVGLSRPRLWWVALLSFALVVVHVGHMFAVRNEGWGTSHARLSLGYLVENLRVNGGFYLGDERFPVIFTLLAILGLLSWSFRRERMALALYFFLFFGIYLVFYAGSYDYGADVRYSLMTYPPLAMLGGLGAARLVGWLERITAGLPAQGAVTAGLAFQFLSYAPLLRATSEEAWAARADVRFARSVVPQLRGNSYVLTHNPGMFHVWGINAGQMSRVVTNPSYLDYVAARYAGGVYLHWNFWCNVPDPVQQEFCRKALENRPVETVREHRERDQRYAIYRIELPSGRD
ncbi:MAG: hypothetical protein GEV06_23300 [Luteitalea sp.]|nr:hypothetical protein [Luteitalea sp.]